MRSKQISEKLILSLLVLLSPVVTSAVFAQSGSAYCFGDGTGTPCPCSANGQPGEGCANTGGTGGAILTGSGNASVLNDTFQLDVVQVPGAKAGLLLRGANQLNGGLGNPAGDGLLCTGGQVARSQIQVTVGGATSFTNFQGAAFGASSYAIGVPTNYLFWYRDPSNPCSGSGFNFTNAWTVTWALGTPHLALPMVRIPAGVFQMGSNATGGAPYFGNSSHRPVHSVTISKPFWIGETELTQAQYEAVTGVNPSTFIGANNPVEYVNWNHARAYCTALTAQEQAAGNVPNGYEYRLPTEAEWEYACRAGTTTEFGVGSALTCGQAQFRYSYHSNSSCDPQGTAPVASFAPNQWGLYDMHGNVWEWCLDSYSSYSAAPQTDPFSSGGPTLVFRGGSLSYDSNVCRSAARSGNGPQYLGGAVGFRVVFAEVLVP